MNLKIFSSALLIAGLASPAAFAADGTITFTGSITSVTCDIDSDRGGKDFTVDLGGVNASSFGGVVGTVPSMVGFKLLIGGNTECTDGTIVYANFEPGALVDPTGMVKIGTGAGDATGVLIRLFNENSQKIDINGEQNWVKKTVADNRAVLQHFAGYESTSATVNAGAANGQVTYTIRFET
jgi:major type 1 subunit fimbrin (pilin)